MSLHLLYASYYIIYISVFLPKKWRFTSRPETLSTLVLQESANRAESRPETGWAGGKREDHRGESTAWRSAVKEVDLHSVSGWRNPLLHMVSAGLNTTSAWTCAEFEHKAKFPYKKAQVLQKLAQLGQLQLPQRFLCSFTQIINSSAWQIWPSPRLSLVGGGARFCSFKASYLDMTVGSMSVARDNNWSWHNWECTGSRARTWVHDFSLTALMRLRKAGCAQGLYHHLHNVWQ